MIDATNNNNMYLENYTRSLVKNINKKKLPLKMNLVFDGGAFNGLFGYGVLLYLKELERQKLTTIKKISGTSIGSVLGLVYILDLAVDLEKWFCEITGQFKQTGLLTKFHTNLKELIIDISKDQIKSLEGRLYITYYNVKKKRRTVVKKYRNKEHLYQCICRSSYLPVITDGGLTYQDKYIDGITPYIFNTHPTLFVKLLTRKKMLRCMSVKNEKNIQYRILTGLADANEFFMEGSSNMCCFVHERSLVDLFLLQMREYFCLIIYFVIRIAIHYNTILPNAVSQLGLSKCKGVFLLFMRDLIG